jgi:hypothetical protein
MARLHDDECDTNYGDRELESEEPVSSVVATYQEEEEMMMMMAATAH